MEIINRMKKFLILQIMKKLSINKLNEYPTISEEEQMMLKGGDGDPDFSAYGYVLPEVTVYGKRKYSSCPACDHFHQINNPVQGHNHQSTTTPLGEFFFNTLPHMLEWWGHRNTK